MKSVTNTVTKTPAKSVRSLLSGDRGPLRRLIGHSAGIARVATLVDELLPAPLNRHCRVVNFTDGILVLHTDAPTWTTRLRFDNPRLLAALRERLGGPGVLREIRLRTAPTTAAPPRAPAPGAILPAAAAAHLRKAAESITEPALRAALLRLASRSEPTP